MNWGGGGKIDYIIYIHAMIAPRIWGKNKTYSYLNMQTLSHVNIRCQMHFYFYERASLKYTDTQLFASSIT